MKGITNIYTVWKVSNFPAFGLNTERYGVYLLIQFKCGKILTRKTSVFGHFSRSVNSVIHYQSKKQLLRNQTLHIGHWSHSSIGSYSPSHEPQWLWSAPTERVFSQILRDKNMWVLSIENELFVTLEQIIELAKEPIILMVEEYSIIFDPFIIPIISLIVHKR